MGIRECTCRWQVAEPSPPYKPAKLKKPKRRSAVRWAKVLTIHYPPLASNPNTPWRRVPWINLKGHWLQRAGFEIGAVYRVDVGDKKLVLKAQS